MKRRFEVIVQLKEGLADPQGKAIQDALATMGFEKVAGVRTGKHFELTVAEDDAERARDMVEEIARRLLSNEVIELFWVAEGATAE